MDRLAIRGGVPLAGTAAVAGSKNAALPIMAAAILADGPVTLRGVPPVGDVDTLGRLLATLGLSVERTPDEATRLEVVDPRPCCADDDLVRRMRAGVCVLGPLLGRRGEAVVALPGGCNIGARPIDLHLRGLATLGAEIRVDGGRVVARAKRLRGTTVDLSGPGGTTVTGTCNVLAAATVADGTTVIEPAAREPEVVDFGRFLMAMGARVQGLGTPRLVVEGTGGAPLSATEYTVIPDRIEAATLALAAAVTRGDVTLSHVRPDHLAAFFDVLRAIGVGVDVAPESASGPPCVRIRGADDYRAADVVARPYPGFPTDAQAPLAVLLCLARGVSRVRDAVFPERFTYVPELARMGARLRIDGWDAPPGGSERPPPGSAVIEGPAHLRAAELSAADLRAAAALVLAALAAQGDSVVHGVEHLDRGYDALERKLQQLGARIDRVAGPPHGVEHALRGPNWLRREAPRFETARPRV
jgi:UDP-N-acetylglucosamine 1-carboxyvinyltransferase